MKEPIIGIDLGTTNSEVAIVKDGSPIIITENNKKIVPSFVGLSDDGQILVGEPAKNQYLLYPERTIKSIKRKMGSGEIVTLGDKEYTPQEISAMILMKLKGMAEKYLGQKVTKAVITVPAYFSDAQRQATRDAGEIAGLDVVRIINEPTAAALAYETDKKVAKKILVYDLGGGTFDVSVVSLQEGVVEVLSGHGNNHLGGDDFDEKIAQEIIKNFKGAHDVDLTSSLRAKARVYRASEDAKILLSSEPFAIVEEEYIIEKKGTPLNLKTEIVRKEYEGMIQSYIDETLDAVHTALKGASLAARDVDEILLVGGSTRTPMISELLKEHFNISPRKEIDPDLCVAMGAAVQAAMIAGESVSSVLVDITPYTFGTSVLSELDGYPSPNVFFPLIEKNTPIPVSKSEVFYTVVDYQEGVEVKVYQGENKDATQNILIGSFFVEGLSHVPAGNEIVAHFDLDVNGILHVTATEKRTGLHKSIRIDNAFEQFDKERMKQAKERIGSLFFEDTTAFEKAPKSKTEIEAEELITKAEEKLDIIPQEDRDEVINLIEDIKDALHKGNNESLQKAVDELSEILFYLET
jgi:molecular chaperone DnaK